MKNILQAICNAGGRPLFVGGCVRDKLLNIPCKDIDIEVYNLEADTLINVLSKFGKVDCVGVSFGVVKLWANGQDYDFTLPRIENKLGRGHKGFQVEVNHQLSPTDAASRRDFTINSMAEDIDGDLLDPFRGLDDLHFSILRATSERFVDDPLRVLRGFQFAGRFNMVVDLKTAVMCRKLRNEFDTIAKERICVEFEKWALKSIKPSAGLNFLLSVGWLKCFPELWALDTLEQDKEWHPEGDALTHTGLVCDSAVEIAVRENLNDNDRLVLVLAALCHDLGKATTTELIDGRIRSRGHAEEGEKPTRSLLDSMGFSKKIIDQVIPLVVNHMVHIGVNFNSRLVNRLAVRLHPSNIQLLAYLMEADHSGRHPLPKGMPKEAVKMVEVSATLNLDRNKPSPIIRGRDLINLGLLPSPLFGEILDKCYQEQLDSNIVSLEDGLKFVKGLL